MIEDRDKCAGSKQVTFGEQCHHLRQTGMGLSWACGSSHGAFYAALVSRTLHVNVPPQSPEILLAHFTSKTCTLETLQRSWLYDSAEDLFSLCLPYSVLNNLLLQDTRWPQEGRCIPGFVCHGTLALCGVFAANQTRIGVITFMNMGLSLCYVWNTDPVTELTVSVRAILILAFYIVELAVWVDRYGWIQEVP